MTKIFNIKNLIALLIIISFSSSLSAQYYKATTKAVARLFADKENTSTVISYIPKGKEVDVLVVEEKYLKVLFEESEGYILTTKATLRNTEGEILQVGDNPTENIPVDRTSQMKQKYGHIKGEAILDHKIWKGMNNDMIFDSWGKPIRVERLVKNSKIQERWVYKKSYLILDNDILIQWGPVK